MADNKFKAEACQLYIEQQVEAGLEQGKTAYQIGKELSDEVERLFEAKVPQGTLEKRAQRIRTKVNSVRTDKVNSVRNDIPRYRMTEDRRKILQRAEKIGKEIGLSIEDTLHMALDWYTNR